MDLVLYAILRLLSRPVVCTNFQGLETNTFFLLARSIKDTLLVQETNTAVGRKPISDRPGTKIAITSSKI
jgi:hypothetical protein